YVCRHIRPWPWSVPGYETDHTATDNGTTLTIEGQYGTLVLTKATGEYVYTRTPGTPGDVSDVFTYTLADADGDSDTATLTITIADAPVQLTELPPQADGGDVVVDEKHLDEGSDPDADALTQQGRLKISSRDGT